MSRKTLTTHSRLPQDCVMGKCGHCGKPMIVAEERETIAYCSRKKCKQSRKRKNE